VDNWDRWQGPLAARTDCLKAQGQASLLSHRNCRWICGRSGKARTAALPTLTAQERARKAWKCSPSPTYPPAQQQQGRIIILIGRKRSAGQGSSPSRPEPRLAGERGPRAVPDQKAGPVFFQGREGKKSSGPAGLPALLTAPAAAPLFVDRRVGTEGWAFLDRTKGWRFKQAPFRRG
jgi:hypothetical protein